MRDQRLVKTIPSAFPAIGARGLFLCSRTAVQSLGETFTPGVSVPCEVHRGRLSSSNPLSKVCSLPS